MNSLSRTAGILVLLAFTMLAIFVCEWKWGWHTSVLYVVVVILATLEVKGPLVLAVVFACTALIGLPWCLSSFNTANLDSLHSRVFTIAAMYVAAWICHRKTVTWVPPIEKISESFIEEDSSDPESDSLRIELKAEQQKAVDVETRCRLMIDSAMDAIIVMTNEGLVEDWNPQAESTFGWSKSEVIGDSLAELIIPNRYRDLHHQGVKRFVATWTGKSISRRMELTALKRNGTEFPVELTIVPLNYSGVYHFCAFIRDMTVLQQANRELQERESQISSILNSAAEGIYGLDLQGICTFANAACARLLGYDSPASLIGLNMHNSMHHTRADGLQYPITSCPIYRAFREGKASHVDDEVLWRRDGSCFPTEYWSHPMRHDGELIGCVVTFVDITERRAMQLAQQQLHLELESLVSERNIELSEARDRLELALKGGNVGLWDWNAVTNEVYYSPTYKAQLGYSEKIAWNHFSDWESQLHPDDYEGAHELVNKFFAHETPEYKSMFRLRCSDGSYRWMLAQGTAVFDSAGKPTRMIGVHVDITERIEHENELKRLNVTLEQLNEALQDSNVELQQFAYVASHDLQTPLRAISGFAQFLQTDCEGKLDAKTNNYLDRIINGVRRMQTMIDDLLDFSRVESRAAPFETVCLEQVFGDAVGLLEASIRDTSAQVTRDQLPRIVGDPAQLSQLFSNLIGNGIKYHRTVPSVHVSATESKDGWTVLIRDNGIGIAEKDYDRIFEVFRRLHTRDQYPGTGIGLAVCRRIVKRHRGKIWVTSKIGIGSTFHVWFPVINNTIQPIDQSIESRQSQ